MTTNAPMSPLPISQAEIDARVRPHIDELLTLWGAEQGATKPRDLALMAAALPFPRGQPLRALDLGCGPGDAGLAIRRLYPHARIDGIDRDPFLTSIRAAIHTRDGIAGALVRWDLQQDGWHELLSTDYDVVVSVNALHWFGRHRAAQLLADAHGLLSIGGVFLLAEPVSPEAPFAPGFSSWKVMQPPRYAHEHWERFWSRASAILGYDHTQYLGPRPLDQIGDRLTVAGWATLLRRAHFATIDVLWRDADQVILAAVR